MKTKPIVTKEWLAERLKQSDYKFVIGRALLAIYNNQTDREQNFTHTIEQNGIGFCKPDARVGSIGARAFKAGKLPDWVVNVWMVPTKNGLPRICKYASQLNDIAVEKGRRIKELQMYLLSRGDIAEEIGQQLKSFV